MAEDEPQKGEPMQIAEEAFIYGLPLVMNYEVFYQYFVDTSGPQYKAPINELYNTARVYTPKDTTVITPNSDTPYSFVAMDLRAEPFVICNPDIEKGRYFSVQLVDFYTFNYGYIGSRATGNAASCNMIVGPNWKGEKPAGIGQVFQSETDFSIAIIRTQLFDPTDIDNVKKIQAGYRAVPLSTFEKKAAPPAAAKIHWPKINKKMAEAYPFSYLNFILELCPPTGGAEVELPLRARFAKIGVQAGKPFPPEKISSKQKAMLETAMKNGIAAIKSEVGGLGANENGWRTDAKGIGDRQVYAGDWKLRAAIAMAGIYANDPIEALYPLAIADNHEQKLDGSKYKYSITFPADAYPPANAFWSITMYDGKTQLLIENPINRYLINSPMLPDLKKNADGSVTIYIQNKSPGEEKEANWLPAPDGPIYMAMRLYWPKEAALKGNWKPAPIVRAE